MALEVDGGRECGLARLVGRLNVQVLPLPHRRCAAAVAVGVVVADVVAVGVAVGVGNAAVVFNVGVGIGAVSFTGGFVNILSSGFS